MEVRSVPLKLRPTKTGEERGLDRLIFDNCISVQVQFLPPRCQADSILPLGSD